MNSTPLLFDDIKREFMFELDGAIERDRIRRELSEKQDNLKSKIIKERKLNEDLTKQHTEVCDRIAHMENVCKLMKTHLEIADSDKSKLENARELYQLGKDLTGVRFDFEYCAQHPDSAKGYLMNKDKCLLKLFEMPKNSDALWEQVAATFDVSDQLMKQQQKIV